MNTASHTPGPWVWKEQQGNDMPILFGSNNWSVCDFGNDREYYPREGNPPSAKDRLLIAASPTLLMALEFLLDQCNGFNVSGVYFNEFKENRDALDTAYAAIAKATGEVA